MHLLNGNDRARGPSAISSVTASIEYNVFDARFKCPILIFTFWIYFNISRYREVAKSHTSVRTSEESNSLFCQMFHSCKTDLAIFGNMLGQNLGPDQGEH